MPATALPMTLTVQRAVAETGISRSRLYELAGRGEIEIKKNGRQALITGESLCRYIASLPSTPRRKVA